MTRNITLTLLSIILCSALFAQEIVTTKPQLKAAVIEGFTGIKCPFCPDGNTAIQNVLNANPGRAMAIAIHAGSFAIPDAGQPDFRTAFGNALVSQAGATGFPSGTVNRRVFPDLNENGNTVLSRTQYATAVQRIIQEPAYANVGFSSSFDSDLRKLTIDVEVYYVENPPFGIESNYIHIALTESNIIGYQAGGGSNYSHQRVLRHLITGQWGEKIDDIEAGYLFSKTYTYTVNENWDETNCNLVVYISESRQEVITGAYGTMIDGFHNGEIAPDYGRIFVDNPIQAGETGEYSEFDLVMISGYDTESGFIISPEFNAPADWNIYYEIDGNSYTGETTINIDAYDSKEIKLFVNPGETGGVANCKLFISSLENPELPQKMTEVFVVSGLSNLIVNGSGTKNGINARNYQQYYIDALNNAGCYTLGSIPGYLLEEAFEKNVIDDVENIYFNIGYSIPVLTVGQTNYLTDFVDNGGNLFLAGQDIGRDIMGSGGHSTAITQKMFFQNYIAAAFMNQGDESNNNISFVDETIFENIPDASLSDPYERELKPDNLVAIGTGIEFVKFPNDRAGGIKNTVNEGKIVYLSFGLEQVDNQAVRDSIMKRTYIWFGGVVEESSVENYIYKDIAVYPNPVSEFLNIDNNFIGFSNPVINIYSIDGKLVKTINNFSGENIVNVSELEPAVYIFEIIDLNSVYRTRFIKK